MSDTMEEDDKNEIPSEALTEIAPGGDLVLVVGPNKVRLHVNSVLLKMTSKVFNAMLGPHFKEGQSDNGGLKEIELPEDNVDGMKIICAAIHHRNKDIPADISMTCVLQVAISADKYDCTEALLLGSHYWLQFKPDDDFDDLNRVMIAAYLFNNADAFANITQKMVLGNPKLYRSLMNEDQTSHIPLKVILMLEEKRCWVLLQLNEILLQNVNLRWKSCGCDYRPETVVEYLNLLDKFGLLLGSHSTRVSVSNIIQKAEKLASFDELLGENSGYCSSCGFEADEPFTEILTRELEYLKLGSGLCLDCLRGQHDSDHDHLTIEELQEENEP